MKKSIISLFCTFAILFGCVSILFPFISFAADANKDNIFIEGSELPLKLWYDEPAPITSTEHSQSAQSGGAGVDQAWEKWSLSVGNAYFGANVFGRTETERIQISEKTLSHQFHWSSPDNGGYNNFSETFIDFNHTTGSVTDYIRYLDLKTAISGVDYTYNGVKYTREYFTSYPDKALVIKLDADTDGALSFTLRPTIPYEQDYMYSETDGKSKTGTVTSSVTEDGVGYIELAGKMGYYDLDFLAIYKVYTDGSILASTTENNYTDITGKKHNDIDGTLIVEGARSAYIVVTLGTDYQISTEIINNSRANLPTMSTGLDYTKARVEGEMNKIDAKFEGKSFEEAYNLLKISHISDHNELFGRVSVDFGCNRDDFAITTDALLENYKANGYGNYLETLLFQYGRYLLIASSRDGALPANLQGVWNTYNTAPWGSGYWHNINVQMNYWPAFSTNLSETFEAYVDYNNAYMKAAENFATLNIEKYNPDMLGKDGGNGWVVGTAQHAFTLASDRSSGNLGFTTQLFWDYYQFTKDPTILRHVYDVLVNAARYITKCVELDENGNYLVSYCDSPEVHVNGVWYYTKGTTYAQTFAYLNNYNALEAAKKLGIDLTDSALLSTEEYSILSTIMEQIDKYDPIHVGLSGQIKEFREEDYYGSIGDDPNHRHISQLVGLYPGNIINSTTPAWLDAAKVTLEKRAGGNSFGGWVYAHKSGLYARTKDGEMARAMVSGLLTKSTNPNLFTRVHNVFQIDSSLGITAGMAEMLLQSHEGYIEPLAAIPDEWSTGSYTRLMARGNFEVSAAWENGVAKTLNVKSNSGETARVYYPSVTSAKVVKASDGKNVDYTVSGTNLISFETEIGETYIISGFNANNKPDAPNALNYSREKGFGAFTLVWSPVANAASYNVSVAIENAPTYTFIKNNTATSITYTPDKQYENARMTFAVTAIGFDGTESDRTVCYFNPIETDASVDRIKGYVLESGELQVVVKANANTGKYKLYEKSSFAEEYTLVTESKTPILITENYDPSKKYAVSVVSYYNDAESELFKLSSISNSSVVYNENVFKGKYFVESTNSKASPNVGYEYSKLTDGIIDVSNYTNGRFSTYKNTASVTESNPNPEPTNIAEATIDLGYEYVLHELRFYLFSKNTQQMGTNFTVEAYSNGEWVSIVKNVSNAELIKNHIKNNGNGNADVWLVFDLGGIVASKIRFYGEPLPGASITYYEAECYGTIAEKGYTDVLADKTFIGSAPIATASGLDAKTFDYSKLTDGIMSKNWKLGRYSSVSNGKFNGTVDLEDTYYLNELRFYVYEQNLANAGTNWTIETYFDEKWTTVKTIATNAELQDLVTQLNGNSIEDKFVSIDLGGVYAEKIRLSADAVSGKSITLYEIRCIGIATETLVDYSNILSGKEFIGKESTMSVPSAGGNVFTYDKLTDGVISTDWTKGRYSSNTNGKLNGTIDLEGTYKLDTLKIYAFEKNILKLGNNWKIEVYENEKWIVVKTIETNAEFEKYRVKGSAVAPADEWFAIDLGGVYAEKIRITATACAETTISLYEIKCSAIPAEIFGIYLDNILSDKEFIGAAATPISPEAGGNVFTYDKLTDGIISTDWKLGRYSSVTNGKFDGSVEFDGVYLLQNLKLYVFDKKIINAGQNWKIEIYYDGEWKTVKTIATNAELEAYKVTRTGTTLEDEWIQINLSGVAAEKLRITADACEEKSLTLCEIRCTGYELNSASVDRTSMINVYEKLANLNVSNEHHNGKMELFKNYLTDFKLTEKNAELYTAEMHSYYQTALKDLTAQIAFVPKTSIILGDCLSLNLYVPVDTLVKFTFNGTVYEDLDALEDKKVTLNCKEYYLISVPIAAAEGAKEFKLIATIATGDNKLTGTFTVSIPKYAKIVLAGSSEVEKQIVRDVLSYIRAAYNYFDPDNTDEISQIDSIIGARYDETAPYTPEGSTAVPSLGLSSATFALNSTPALKFYIDGSAPADAYEFYIGSKKLNSKAETEPDNDRTYIIMDVYAYEMCETVTYTINGEKAGTFHINAYYEWAKTQNDEVLVKLVERFWKYCQSARDYKNSVKVQINYTDENGNSLADSKTMHVAKGTELSVPSPAVLGYYTRDLYLKAIADSSKVINVVYKEIPKDTDKAIINEKLSDIVCWGDSITAGAAGNQVDIAKEHGIDLVSLGSSVAGSGYTKVLENLIASKVCGEVNVINCGVGGETSATIAARADTESYYLYLEAETTVSDAPIVIPLMQTYTTDRIGILRQGGSNTLNPVTIIGKDSQGNEVTVTGNISLALSSKAPAGTDIYTCDYSLLVYTFTRTDGNTASVTFESGTKVITSSSYLYDGNTCIIFMGENGGHSDINELIKQQEQILKACDNPKNYLIVSTHSGNMSSRKELEDALTARWGKNYINMGTELNTRKAHELAGFSEAAIVSVQQSIIDGAKSNLLVHDRVHPNAVGYAVIGNIMFERLFELGAFDAIFDYYDSLNA